MPVASGTAAIRSFDTRTVAWFSAFCVAASAFDTGRARQTSGDLGAQRSAAGKVFTDAAAVYETAADQLAELGAPGIPAGNKLQDTLLATLPMMATAAGRGAAEINTVGDLGALQAAVDRTDDAVRTASAPLADFSEAMAAPALAQQAEAIPACHSLFT